MNSIIVAGDDRYSTTESQTQGAHPMGSDHSNSFTTHPNQPRVLADYGGRRRIFERRIDLSQIDIFERRAGMDRRSGFDRRSTLIPSLNTKEKRKGFASFLDVV